MRCAQHELPSIDTCSRCGAFICEDCRRWLSERAFCGACLQRLGTKPSREAVVALLLATLGFIALVPGFFAIPLANCELRRIAGGEAPAAGEAYASLARTLGWVEVLVAIGIGISLLVRGA